MFEQFISYIYNNIRFVIQHYGFTQISGNAVHKIVRFLLSRHILLMGLKMNTLICLSPFYHLGF